MAQWIFPLGRIYIVSSEVVADNHHRSGNKGWHGQQSHVVWAIHLPRIRIAVATPTTQTRQPAVMCGSCHTTMAQLSHSNRTAVTQQ